MSYKWTIWKIRNEIKYSEKLFTVDQIFKRVIIQLDDNISLFLNSNVNSDSVGTQLSQVKEKLKSIS